MKRGKVLRLFRIQISGMLLKDRPSLCNKGVSDMNIAQGLAHARKVFGTHEAVTCGEIHYTWNDFDQRTDALARGLAALDVQRGDRVAVLVLDKTFAGHITGRDTTPTVSHIVYIGDETPLGMIHYDDVVSKGATMQESVDQEMDDNDLSGLFYTGGTTGRAKGVMLSH